MPYNNGGWWEPKGNDMKRKERGWDIYCLITMLFLLFTLVVLLILAIYVANWRP